MSRADTVCIHCEFFALNWCEEVAQTMAENAPGVECSHEFDVNLNEPCGCYCPVEGLTE